MSEPAEAKSEKLGLNITPTEMSALQFIERIHPGKYDGTASVLRDYSIADAVIAYKNAKVEVGAGA